MELKASIRPLCIFAKDLWPLGKVVPWCTDSFVLTGLYKNATTRLRLRLHHSFLPLSVWQVVHTHGRCSGQDEGAMGNVKRCGQVYVCISTAVKKGSVILYFCGSKLLDLFIYFLAHLTTATHLSVSLAKRNQSLRCPIDPLRNSICYLFHLFCCFFGFCKFTVFVFLEVVLSVLDQSA